MNKFKYIFLIISCILLCGCSKVNTNMTINNDKSMIISIDLLLDSETKKSKETLLEEKEKEIRENGYTIEDKSDGFYSGIKISKRYNSIDETTYTGNERIKLSNYGQKDFDYNKIFSYKKGIINNTYSAYFDFESLITKYNKLNIKEETKITTEDYIKKSEYTFTLTLPNKPVSSNATSISDDGLTLTWKLDPTKDNEVNFIFKMNNKTNIIIISSISGLIILLILFIVLKLVIKKVKKRNLSERVPIYKGYDESIKDEVENNIGKIATAITNGPVTIKEKHSEVEEIMDFNSIEEKEELIPETSSKMTNLNKLNDYEYNNQDDSLRKSYIENTQTQYKRENLFINNNKYEEPKEEIIVKKQQQEIDIPNMEELK